jgi:hypothetical protein
MHGQRIGPISGAKYLGRVEARVQGWYAPRGGSRSLSKSNVPKGEIAAFCRLDDLFGDQSTVYSIPDGSPFLSGIEGAFQKALRRDPNSVDPSHAPLRKRMTPRLQRESGIRGQHFVVV